MHTDLLKDIEEETTGLIGNIKRLNSIPQHLFEGGLIQREYARFLWMKIQRKDINACLLSPSPIIDSIWHLHVLDTLSYSNFQQRFAVEIHHNPFKSIDAKEEKEQRKRETQRFYAESFGEEMPTSVWDYEEDADVVPSKENGITLKIRTLSGKEFELNVGKDETVGMLKKRIQEKEGIPIGQQRLIFKAKQLDDDNVLLSDLSIEHNSLIHLLLKLRC
eukprot:TRINITY_DN11389_c0_g1_i1.p1 TRINITY_DN11389_c0_g1~~TRINITY_DN11389_c0_g1_i1.p1  ORF type:complete len:219 (-),score=92.85 TRINITY_DN11389_c0_g1_i1:66-722(-)